MGGGGGERRVLSLSAIRGGWYSMGVYIAADDAIRYNNIYECHTPKVTILYIFP